MLAVEVVLDLVEGEEEMEWREATEARGRALYRAVKDGNLSVVDYQGREREGEMKGRG